MAKSAEKLIILADVCRGLLARVYNLTPDHFQRPSTLGMDVEKVTKMLVKRFPDHPADLDKIQMELFNKRAQEMVTELQDYYLTFLDVMDFSESALKVLLDMSKSIVGFKFDVNADLMQFYLDLFVSYIQLHLLVARAVDSKLMLSAYAKAYHSTHGNTEPGYLKIVTYIQNFANPLERLRDELKDVTPIIGDTLVTFFPIVMKWAEPQSLQMNKVFAIVEDVKDMDKDTGFDKHIELLSLDKFHLWTLYGYLVCPGGLQRDNALTLLQFCLRDVFCVPVYRDLSMNIHEEFSKIFDSFVGANKFKLSKQKKFLKDAREDAVATLDRHRLCRTILRVELQTMVGVFNEFQQLLAPKFHMVLCALRLARNELLWYFRHIGVPPHKAKKVPKEGEFADPQLSELLFLIDRLITLVLRNKRTVQEYYLTKLTQVDGPNLHSIVDSFNRQARISHGVSEVLSEVLTALSASDNDFEAMRLNWYRVSVQLNTQPQPCSTQIAQPLNQAMLTVVQHSRAIDRLDGLVKLHGSLSGLYWWRPQLTQLLKDSIASSGGQAAHWMAFVVAINHALDNVHRNCPEEQKLIGSSAVKLTESFLGAIVQQLTSLIFAIAGKLSKLRAQIAPVEVVYRLQRASLNKGQTDPLPGYESLYQCRAVIKDLRAYEKIVADICNAVRNVDTITIFNMEFVPREYIYEGVANTVREAIRKISLAEKQIQRPTVILSQLKDIVYAFVHLDRHLTVNLSDIVRDVLVSEFTDPSAGGVGEAVLEELEDKKDDRGQVLINTIAAWYVKEIQTFQERGVTYSPTTKSFVTLNQSSVPVEYHFDYSELRALCTLVGPGGIRVIQRLLLTLISQHVGVIKEILRKNDDALKALSGRFTEKTLWLEQMGRLVDLDKLVRHSILVGTALKFRKLIQSALEEVTRQRVPFLHDSVKTVFLQYPSNVTMDSKLAPVDFLAQDLGLELETADHSLKIALRKHKNVSSDEPLLSHLPELFACSLIAPSWRESQYLIQTESHNNNVHLTATTVTTLVTAFHGIPVVTSDIPVDTRIRADLERFLRSSCYCLLHMSQAKPNEAFSGFPLQSLSVFIEFLVKESGCLTLSILEDFYPFTLLRTNYIQMYEKQAVNGKSYVPVADDEKE